MEFVRRGSPDPAVGPTGGLQGPRLRPGTGRPAVARVGRVRRPCPNRGHALRGRAHINPPLAKHWYLHNSRLFVTCASARDWAAFKGGGSLVNFRVTMDGLQCEGSPNHRRSSEVSARGEGLVANGVTLPVRVDVENRVPRRLTLNRLTRVKPQHFRWSCARNTGGFMMRMPRLSGLPCHDWNRGFRNGT